MSENMISRREFSKKILTTAVSVSFLETIFLTSCSEKAKLSIAESNKIIAPKAVSVLNHWVLELNEICNDLRTSEISQKLWQEQIERLFSRIELEELLRFIDFEALTKNFQFPDVGVNTKKVNFPAIADLPVETVFIKKIFGMKKGRAIIPHGHNNMTSAHFILNGSLTLKHFQKIEEEKNHWLLRPTIGKEARSGDYSSISDEKDNVHWFVANTDSAFTFDVIMLDLNGEKFEIQNLDIAESQKDSQGLIRAKKIDVETGLKKYGKSHHQINTKMI